MNEEINKIKSGSEKNVSSNTLFKRKNLFKVIFGAIIVATLGSISYAYFSATREQTGINAINSSCFDVSFENESQSINLKNAYPIENDKGQSGEPYVVTIANRCEVEAKYRYILSSKDGSFDDEHIDVSMDGEAVKELSTLEKNESFTKDEGYTNSYIVRTGSLKKGESRTFNLRLWIDDSTTYEEVAGKTWQGQVRIVSTVAELEKTTSDETIAKMGLEVNKEMPDFSKVAPKAIYTDIFNTPVESKTMSTSNQSDYYIYFDEYKINEYTGAFELVNPQTCKYSECYETLRGKYIRNTYGSSSLPTSIPTVWRNSIYYVEESTTLETLFYKESDLALSNYDHSLDGVFEMEDDYGTSYYYRGAMENNYVKFGKWKQDVYIPMLSHGTATTTDTLEECQSLSKDCYKLNLRNKDMLWRIVRINGDGSLRIAYDGLINYDNWEETAIDVYGWIIGFSPWQSGVEKEEDYDVKYNGYMYGDTKNGLSSSKSEAQRNELDSTMKMFLERWFENNLKGSSYISDNLFCNDRSTGSSPNSFGEAFGDTGLGYGREMTSFGYMNRTDYNDPEFRQVPRLKCSQKNDAFTANDEKYGNAATKYPIGLITADELALAGSKIGTVEPIKNYLYKDSMPSSTFSPAYTLYNVIVHLGGISYIEIMQSLPVRPVINLSPNFVDEMVGAGTIDDPYRVE